MKKAILAAMLIAMVTVLAAFAVSYAQEVQTAPAAGPQNDLQEAYGEVVSVDQKAGAITISEYDYEKDEDTNKTYTLDKMATYENVKSLAEIKQGDWTALTLRTQKDGPAVVTSVYVERYDLEEEEPSITAVPSPAVAVQPAPAAVPAPTQPPVEAPQDQPATDVPLEEPLPE